MSASWRKRRAVRPWRLKESGPPDLWYDTAIRATNWEGKKWKGILASSYELMQRMLLGHFSAQCLHAAATLGFADIIHEEGSKSVEELASTAKCDPRSARRLLRTLASMEFLLKAPIIDFPSRPSVRP